jgi:hypothetical protein
MSGAGTLLNPSRRAHRTVILVFLNILSYNKLLLKDLGFLPTREPRQEHQLLNQPLKPTIS